MLEIDHLRKFDCFEYSGFNDLITYVTHLIKHLGLRKGSPSKFDINHYYFAVFLKKMKNIMSEICSLAKVKVVMRKNL